MANNGLHKYTVQEAQNASLGQVGFDYITTGTETGNWTSIQMITTGQIDCVTSIGDDLTNVTISAGHIIYGPFTSITVDSGSVIAYRG